MPKIAEIQETPNPNSLKFTLREPLSWGVPHSYENAAEAETEGDELARALFAIGHVTNVFYVDRWLTVTQDGGADWRELVRKIAVPLRAAPGAGARSAISVDAAASIWSRRTSATASWCSRAAMSPPGCLRWSCRSLCRRLARS